jgi:4-amino-4-deoxy-L-arabinose transferase-like glycosyltransferase
MPESRAADRLKLWACAALIIIVVWAARFVPGPRTIDDAFITFRYSDHLLDGAGFVYNIGVQTLGTTTPLWAGLMAVTGGILTGRDFQQYAIVWSALADSGTCIALFLLARRVTGSALIGLVPALLWALSPMSVTFAVGGMETSLVIFWMLAAFALLALAPPERSLWREAAIGLSCALGLLTRVDAILWVAPLLAVQLVSQLRHRRVPWATYAGVAVVLVPWAFFSMAAFGTPLPNSVTAKRYAYRIEPLGAFTGLIRAYSNLFFTFDLFGSIATMVSGLLVLATGVIALVYCARRHFLIFALLVYPWLYLLTLAILNPLMFRWYFAPPLPALMLGVVIGLWVMVRPLERVHRRLPAALTGVIAIVCLASTLSGWTLTPDHGPNRPAPRMAWHQIELFYQEMAERMVRDHGVTRESRVASADIGTIGFFTGAVIIDTVGLVTPELTAYYPVDSALVASDQNYAIPPQLIFDTQPEFLVTMEGFIREGLANNPAFLEGYQLVETIPTDFYGTGMQLWQRTRR